MIVQADAFMRSRIRTAMVLMITKNLRLAHAPGNVLMPRSKTGLPHDSVANVSQVYTIDRSHLTEKVSHLPMELMRGIDTGLRLALSF